MGCELKSNREPKMLCTSFDWVRISIQSRDDSTPDLMCALLPACLAFLFLLSRSPAAPPIRPISEFTTTDPKKSQLLDKTGENASYLCAGRGKYQVLLQTTDGRSWLDLLVGETVVSLSRETFEACSGANPKRSDQIVEWRGFRQGKQFTPFAICFRMASEDRREKATQETVVVVKLDGLQSRVIGQVKGGAAKEEVHAMADRLCSER